MTGIKRLNPLVNIKMDELNFDYKDQKLEVRVNNEFVGNLSVKLTDGKKDVDFCYFEGDDHLGRYIEKILGNTNFDSYYESPYEFADILQIHLINVAELFNYE